MPKMQVTPPSKSWFQAYSSNFRLQWNRVWRRYTDLDNYLIMLQEIGSIKMEAALLSHIAASFVSQYENVANASLAYLLNNYDAARSALGKLIGKEDLPHRFLTELATGENGRPDITGLDPDGRKRIIIEGKFWAGLTQNQPANYLAELDPEGVLIFVIPERRRLSFLTELGKRLGSEVLPETMRVITWAELTDSIDAKNAKNPTFSLASDLFQLRSLYTRMDATGMAPLSASDLDPMNGRIAYQLADLIDECRNKLSAWEPIDLRNLRATAWKLGYGFYFRAYGLGCQLVFSTERWFSSPSRTPFWLIIRDENFRASGQITNILCHWDPKNAFEENGIAHYAIHLNPGMDKQEAVEALVRATKNAIETICDAARIQWPAT